jgi:hypothetical protein
VGPALLGRAAAPPRLRRPGAGPLLGPDRALPAAVRRGQHDGRLPLDAGVALPPAAPSGVRPSASPAHRVHPEVDAAPQGRLVDAGGLHDRAPSEPVLPDTVTLDGQRGDRVLLASGKVVYELEAEREKRGDPAPRSCASSSWLPAPGEAELARPARTTPTPSSSGAGRAARTRAPGRSWRSTCPSCSRARRDTAPARPSAGPASASPATGSHKKHAASRPRLLAAAFDR